MKKKNRWFIIILILLILLFAFLISNKLTGNSIFSIFRNKPIVVVPCSKSVNVYSSDANVKYHSSPFSSEYDVAQACDKARKWLIELGKKEEYIEEYYFIYEEPVCEEEWCPQSYYASGIPYSCASGNVCPCIDKDNDDYCGNFQPSYLSMYDVEYNCNEICSKKGGDCDDNNIRKFPTNPEICDGYDNDCNYLIDDESGGLAMQKLENNKLMVCVNGSWTEAPMACSGESFCLQYATEYYPNDEEDYSSFNQIYDQAREKEEECQLAFQLLPPGVAYKIAEKAYVGCNIDYKEGGICFTCGFNVRF